jgi:hypothetical protein
MIHLHSYQDVAALAGAALPGKEATMTQENWARAVRQRRRSRIEQT